MNLLGILARNRIGAAAIILTIVIGIGFSLALITVADALLWRESDTSDKRQGIFVLSGTKSYPQYLDLSAQLGSVRLAAVASAELSVAGGGYARFECVTPDYLSVMGASLILGRGFERAGDERSIVLSEVLWRQLGNPHLDSSLLVAGRQYSIIGVASRQFSSVTFERPSGWIDLRGSPGFCSFTGRPLLDSAESYWLDVVGRLSPTTTLEQINTDVAHILKSPPSERGEGPKREVESLSSVRAHSLGSLRRAAGWMTAGALALLAMVVLNVSALFGFFWAQYRHAVAVRLFLGANRRRLCMQALGAVALLVCILMAPVFAVNIVVMTALESYFPISAVEVVGTWRSVCVAVSIGTVVAGLISIAPILQTARTKYDHLHSGRTMQDSKRSSWFRAVALSVQVALATFFIVMTQLFVRTVDNLITDTGYDLARIAVIEADAKHLQGSGESREAIARIKERLQSSAEVESLTVGSGALIDSSNAIRKTSIGRPGNSRRVSAFLYYVDTEYFQVVGTRLLEGPGFRESNIESTEATAVLSSITAAKLWPDGTALGQCLTFARLPCVRVVGIAEPRRAWQLVGGSDEVFVPSSESVLFDKSWSPTSLTIRTIGSAQSSLSALVRAVSDVGESGHFRTHALSELADTQLKSWRMNGLLFGLFGGVALLLSSVGVFANYSLYIDQRRPELAVKLAIGAGPEQLARSILYRCASVAIGGIVLGGLSSYWAAEASRSLWYGVAADDPSNFASAALIVSLAALTGVILPLVSLWRMSPASLMRTY